MDDIQRIAIEKIDAHPDNPRLTFRQDVVDGIAAQIEAKGFFDSAHALLVRPLNGRYQILRGHHRWLAGKQVGLETLPCWVREMGDTEAYMQLILGNVQGELRPIEIGIHALQAVELSEGGRSVTGGISEYARRVGKTKQYVSQLREAAEVLGVVKQSSQVDSFLDKAQHLAAIHKADEELWQILVDKMLDAKWSAEDTRYWVGRVCEFEISDKWQLLFLPLRDVVERFLSTKEFAPKTVIRLIKLAEAIEALIEEYDVEVENFLRVFHKWLSENAGEDSWDVRQITKYRRQIEQQLRDAEFELLSKWHLGDWRKFIDTLDEESVHLLLTDPPYGIEYQSDYRLDRRGDKRHANVLHDTYQEAIIGLKEMLVAFKPKLAANAHILCFTHWQTEEATRRVLEEANYQIRGSLIWVKNNTGMGDVKTTFAPRHERIIHAVKGSPILFEREADVLFADRIISNEHPTQKPVKLLERLIEVTTVEGELVIDPFAGTASTLIAAQNLHRVYWGCELSEIYYQIGKQQLKG